MEAPSKNLALESDGMLLDGRVAIVTGASSALGCVHALFLARRGGYGAS